MLWTISILYLKVMQLDIRIENTPFCGYKNIATGSFLEYEAFRLLTRHIL